MSSLLPRADDPVSPAPSAAGLGPALGLLGDTAVAAAPVGLIARRLPAGAEVTPDGVHFRVWAPKRYRVDVVLAAGIEQLEAIPLAAEGNGYFSALVPTACAGTLYWLRLDGEEGLFADPASRFQPEGPMGPSEVVDPAAFAWTDGGWRGVDRDRQVIYELHIGTFTPEGTWKAAAAQLPELADLGITLIEVMPVSDFAGSFGWGYDGVNLFAPTRLYGGPDDFRAFVDAAHAAGIGVILDVVYNHLGPVGNFLPKFADSYFSSRHDTDWGKAINFDDQECGPVREYFIANAAYWIDEYHLDGLRLDATQNIYDFDETHEHILTAISRRAREAAGSRSIFVVAENEPQETRLLNAPEDGGHGLDAMWNDDLHHSAMVALTGRNEAYYTDYLGKPQEFVSSAKHGFLYQGQWYTWQKQPRGTSAFGHAPQRFVTFIQNHDQVANSGKGERVHALTSRALLRAMTAYILLIPGTPMLFMGQEFAASAPFLYFADHDVELARLVHDGRKDFLRQFRSMATPEMQIRVPRPDDRRTFEACKLDFSERERHADVYRLHKDLLALRRTDPVIAAGRPVDGAVLAGGAFVLRFFGEREDRLLVVNLAIDLHLDPAPEPLLAPCAGRSWGVLWSSEDPRYGGCGTPPVYTRDNWRIPGRSAVLMQPSDASDLREPEPDSSGA